VYSGKRNFYSVGMFSLMAVLSLLFLSKELFCQSLDSRETFFDNIELSIRNEYIHCTGDSSPRPIHIILKWKNSIDSLNSLPGYAKLLKSYCEETGINPVDVRACDILEWQKRKLREKSENEKLIQEHIRRTELKKSDSAFVEKEISGISRSVFDYHDIPFGVSKKSFRYLAERSGLTNLSDRGHYIESDSVPLGNFFYKGAFHFDTSGKYFKYELESELFPLDSLDKKVRFIAEDLIADFRMKSGNPPDHIYGVGRFDIVSGRLSILAMWRTENISAYIGLATYKYKYYAKAIISNR